MGEMMAKKEYKIPDKFRNVIEPMLMKDEVIICSFRESFRWDFDWDTLYPKWLVLTNLRLLILSRTLPGIEVEENHLGGMNVDVFRDNVGFYDAIEFRTGSQLLYRMPVFRRRRKEAEGFEREVAKAISKLETGPTQAPKDSKDCEIDKDHLRELQRMGAITQAEYDEEEQRPCEK